MKVTVITAKDLDGSLLDRWQQLRQGREDLVSPFYHPAFTQTVGRWRTSTRVAVIENSGKVTGFFPFDIGCHRIGRPVGEFLSDYHGVIGVIESAEQVHALLRESGLICWDFDHLPMTQVAFNSFRRWTGSSPVMDLSRGYPAFTQEKRAAVKEMIKARRLERDVGPLRFTYHDNSPSTWGALRHWKASQYVRSGKVDFLKLPWVVGLLGEIAQTREQNSFEGVVSTLCAGDQLVAIHFGMREGPVWHYWFPAYDSAFRRYSPGFLLLLKMAEHGAAHGIRWVDLGQGSMLYKARLANLEIPLIGGSVELPHWYTSVRKARRYVRRIITNSPMAPAIRELVHGYRT